MKNKKIFYVGIIIFSLLFIIIDKFILVETFGWLETIPFFICIILLIFSIIKLFQTLKLNIILIFLSIVLILWFCMLSIDFKRHKNLYAPLFKVGYDVKEDYNINLSTGKEYKAKSSFYLFGIKISEVYCIED